MHSGITEFWYRQFWKNLPKQPGIHEYSISEYILFSSSLFALSSPFQFHPPETLLDSSKEPVADAEPCSMSFDPNGTYYRQTGETRYSWVEGLRRFASLPGYECPPMSMWAWWFAACCPLMILGDWRWSCMNWRYQSLEVLGDVHHLVQAPSPDSADSVSTTVNTLEYGSCEFD